MSSNISSAKRAADVQASRDNYMQIVTSLFEKELVAVYDSDASAEAVKQLTACIEAGIAVWGHPLAAPDPTASV